MLPKPFAKLTLTSQKTKLFHSISACFTSFQFYPMTIKHNLIFIYTLTLMGIMIWIALILLAPYLRSQSSILANFIYAVFSPTCHQIPSRCIHAFGYPLAVCARCLGIYVGFLLGTVIFPFIKGFSVPSLPQAKMIILVSVPIAMDAAGNILGVWSSSNWVRFGTGTLWGIILPFYFLAGISDFILRHNRRSLP
jgi:uncharacterized membrane protein